MSVDYSALLTDRTGVELGKLPTIGLSYEREIGGGGSCTFGVPLDNAYISGVNRNNLSGWASEIDLYRDGQPVHSGPVLGPAATQAPAIVQITSATATRWLNERPVLRDLLWTIPTEQTAIYAALVAYAQGITDFGPKAECRLEVDYAATGVLRQRNYIGVEHKLIGDACSEIQAVINGFDAILEYEVTDGVVHRVLTTHYPHVGQEIAKPLKLGQGGITGMTLSENINIATRVLALGQGEGSLQWIARSPSVIPGGPFFSDADHLALEEHYGVHVAVVSYTDINVQATLQAHADEVRRLRTPPVTITGLSYTVCDATPFRFVTLGDTVPISADLGWMSFETTRRIVKEKVTVGNGTEVVELTFNDPVEA